MLLPCLSFREQRRAPHPFPLEDDQQDALGRGDVRERIAVDHEQVGVVTLDDETDARVGAEETGRAERGGLERNGNGIPAATQS